MALFTLFSVYDTSVAIFSRNKVSVAGSIEGFAIEISIILLISYFFLALFVMVREGQNTLSALTKPSTDGYKTVNSVIHSIKRNNSNY